MATDSTAFNLLPNLLRMGELRGPRAVPGEAESTFGSNMSIVRYG